MDEKPKNLWKYVDENEFHIYVAISTVNSTTEENVYERVVYIEDLEKRKQAYGICGECKEPGLRPTISKDVPKLLVDLIIKCWDAKIKNRPTTKELYQLLKKCSDTSYTAQSTSANPISECLDVQLSELELNEICQDSEHNIE
ncbi:kinase-like domain-containing protein [Rhizophagus irregularis DAOM 181602=DAOM 197198]|nr:kinase-like domain-containing protein [Rhizophagus irregularis DAOM 181602=DAOM 197198]